MAGPQGGDGRHLHHSGTAARLRRHAVLPDPGACEDGQERAVTPGHRYLLGVTTVAVVRSEEHTSELQSPCNLVCRLLLEKKKTRKRAPSRAAPDPTSPSCWR